MSKSEDDLPKGIYEDIDFAVLLQIGGRMIAQYVDAIAKDCDLSGGHLSVLGMIHRKPDLVQSVYGSILAINDATLGRYVEKLAERGLILRERCANDRRTVRLSLTPTGTDLILDVKSRLSVVRDDMTRRLSPAEIAQLQANLVTFLSAEGPDLQEA